MFNNIQMLRALAAVMVFFYHALPQYEAMGGSIYLYKLFASIGYSGVDIFFVISGFVVAHTTLNKPRTVSSAVTFARRRLLRIYLGYWPFYALMLVLTYVYTPAHFAELALLRSFFLSTIELNHLVIGVTWSLTFELLFYALAAASFALSVRVIKPLLHLGGFCGLLVLLWTFRTTHSTVLLFFSMSLEFLAGMILYMHRDRLKSGWWIGFCALVVVIAFWAGARLNATNDSIRIFTFGSGALALVMLVITLEQSRIYIANRLLVALGDASYTVYLIHASMISLFYFWGIRDFLAGQTLFVRELGFFGYLAFSLWLSKVFYLRIEGPLYRWTSAGRHRDVADRGDSCR